jgi:hypothetical protein
MFSDLGDHGYASSKAVYSGRALVVGAGRHQRKSSARASFAVNRSQRNGRYVSAECYEDDVLFDGDTVWLCEA